MKEWDAFLAILERELGQDAVKKWMPKCVRFDAANIYLKAEDSFQASWFEEHIRPRLKNFVNQNQRPIKVHLEPFVKAASKKNISSIFKIEEDSIDSEMTFENFVPSQNNLVVLKILKEHPLFNPIYIYGAKGAGKTHLLMAAAHNFRKQGKNVFFVKAQTFADHVVQAIRLGEMQAFRKAYREIDVLIIDDIEIFSKKSATQEEFFHTFNTLHTMERPIFLSSNVPPSKLQEIEPRLISRFEWGLSLELEKSDSLEIVKKKAECWKFPLTDELLFWLIESFPNDPILPLQALLLRNSKVSSIEDAKYLLEDILKKKSENALTPEKIIKTVAAQYGITSEDILGKSQVKPIADPRKIAMFYCREKLKLPFQKIGQIFSKDHSTVMSSIKQVQKKIAENKIDPIRF